MKLMKHPYVNAAITASISLFYIFCDKRTFGV